MKDLIRINNISEAHDFFGLEKPKHPLITVYNHKNMCVNPDIFDKKITKDLYHIMFKDCNSGSFKYGRSNYDFYEGTLLFTKPGQVVTYPKLDKEVYEASSGWSLLFHPDFIRKSNLGQHMDDYSFFSYEVNEALHLSDDEMKIIADLRDKIITEYSLNLDKHSQKLIISNIELMLDYCTRFYDRQFITRENMNKDTVVRFEDFLKNYFNSDLPMDKGIPSVSYAGEELNMSSNYLSDLLKKETGRNAIEHIHHFIVEKAKTSLLSSGEPISQIAYGLGFDYPQHFSKIFKKKTGMSPAAYRTVN